VGADYWKPSRLACLVADQYEQNRVDQASERGGDVVADSPASLCYEKPHSVRRTKITMS